MPAQRDDWDGLPSNSVLPRRFRSSACSRTPVVRVGLPTSHGANKAMHAARRVGRAFGQFQYPTPPLAVFQDELIRTYRSFLDKRRATRPETEYREPTPEEWREFQQHFQLRKLELGTCGRPYGTPCKHEHACIRCPMLRIDPKQRGRLTEIIRNLQDCITEARMNGWLGEAQALQTSLQAARDKLGNLERTLTKNPTDVTNLGMPILPGPPA